MLALPPASTFGSLPFPGSAPAMFLREGGREVCATIEGVERPFDHQRPPHPEELCLIR
jgi:hypothetical protein